MWDLRKFSNNVAAVSDDNYIIRYNDLADQAKIIGEIVNPNSLVFCLCTNTIGSLIGYVSFLSNKIVQFILDAKQNHDYLLELIDLYEPEFLWLPAELLNKFSKAEIVYKIHGYYLIRVNQIAKHDLHDSLAILLPTSGTTGSSKMVKLSYINLDSNTKSIIKYLGINNNDKTISSLPMHYSYGLSVINTHLMVGGSITLTQFSIMQRQFWEKMKNQCITSISGVPYTFELMDKIGFLEMDFPNLKILCQAGGKLKKELHKKIAKQSLNLGRNFFVMYGATEASPRISYLPYTSALDKCGSIGVSIPGGTILLRNNIGEIITKPGIVGELEYHGQNVAMGYAINVEDLNKPDEWNGVLRTGDLAKMDNDSFFYIIGRKKRIIKLHGNRINLDEIEQRLIEKFPNDDFACVGNDNMIHLFICNEIHITDINFFLRKIWNFQPRNFQISNIESIPKNTVGKTDYMALNGLDLN